MDVNVEIVVPQGKELAKKTLNSRLGIMGGISILGTTGIVRPMSHDAYIATIHSGISVASAMKDNTLVFTTGRRSERFAMDLFPDFSEEVFIQIGDFFKASLDAASESPGIKEVIITVFFGKAVKMALGYPHTHAAKSELTMKKLSKWAQELYKDDTLAKNIACSNTARHAFTFIYPDYPDLICRVGEKIRRSALEFSHGRLKIRAVIFDFNGVTVFDSGVSDVSCVSGV
jgi:cobalt-precorrin-5B (C1)-methyltransferase